MILMLDKSKYIDEYFIDHSTFSSADTIEEGSLLRRVYPDVKSSRGVFGPKRYRAIGMRTRPLKSPRRMIPRYILK